MRSSPTNSAAGERGTNYKPGLPPVGNADAEAGNRETGTPEENKAAVQGGLAYFGTYSVSEMDKIITYHIEGSTFPNWRGVDQKRLFKLSEDEFTYTNPTPSAGSGSAYAVWKRVK